MTAFNITSTIEVRHTLPLFGREVDVVIEVDYECTDPGSPGRTQGDPDDCYPAEAPEIEFSSVCLLTFPNSSQSLEFDTDELPHDTRDLLRDAAIRDFKEDN